MLVMGGTLFMVVRLYVILSPSALQESKPSDTDRSTHEGNHIGIRSLNHRRAGSNDNFSTKSIKMALFLKFLDVEARRFAFQAYSTVGLT